MTEGADTYEEVMQRVLKVGLCSECGAEITLALAAVLALSERETVRCGQCAKEHEVQEIVRMSALQAFVAWLVGRMDAPHNEEHGAQAAEARGKLLVLAFARLAFARVVEGLRAHGGTGPLKDELLQAQTALTAVVESLDESGCRRTLLLLGDESDQGLAHYTRAALAFSAYRRYTRDQVERVLVTTGAVKGSMASMPTADPELAQAYDELCAQTYRELRDAVWALCRASLASPPPFFTTQGD